MSKTHLKRNITPRSWVLLKKEKKFAVRPHPGAHPTKWSMPIALIMKQIGYAKTTREVKRILNNKEVLVDQRRIKDYKHPLGFMDVLTLKDAKENFRILLDNKGRLAIRPVKEEKQASQKICRIEDKTVIKKGKIQLNLSSNRNVISEEKSYAVGDSVLLELPAQKIVQHAKLEKGSLIFLTGGKHVGRKGVVEKVEGNKIKYSSNKEKSEALKSYAFVIGKEKEMIVID